MRRFFHRQILCRLGWHVVRDDPDVGWTCRYCYADGTGHPRV